MKGQQAERAVPGRVTAKHVSGPGENARDADRVCKKSYDAINLPHASVCARHMLSAGVTDVNKSAKPALVLLHFCREDVWLQGSQVRRQGTWRAPP